MHTMISASIRVVCRLLAASLVVLTWQSWAAAQSGTWTSLASGDYNTAGNWASNQIASGAGNTADFSTLDIASDVSVTLNANLTIGNILFGDTNTGTGGTWELRTDNVPLPVITLDNSGSKPNITVNTLVPVSTFDDAFVGHSIAGTMGFNKLGDGILTLGAGTANTITGGINVNAGTLRVQSAIPAQAVTLANGTTLQTAAAHNGGVTIAEGGTVTYTLTGGNNSASNVTAPGTTATLNLNIATNNTTLSAGGAWTGFSTVNLTGQNPAGVSFLRVMPNPTGGPPAFNMASFANTHLHLDNAQLLIRTNSQGNTMAIGELTGTSTGVLSGGNSGSAARYQLGDTSDTYTYAGQINGQAGISINKVGTGTITFSGAIVGGTNGSLAVNNTPARQGGVFRVTAGTLKITGQATLPGGPAANPNILTTVDILGGATFDVASVPGGTFTSSVQQKIQGSGTFLGNLNHAAGFIQAGDVGAPTAANEDNLSSGVTATAGTLTFSGNLTLAGGNIIHDMSPTPAGFNDLVQVTGTTTLTSGKIIPSILTTIPAAGLTYTVLNSTSGFSGAAANLTVDFPGRGTDPVPFLSGNNLQFTTPAGGIETADIVWTGATNTTWDIETTQNWLNGATPDRYFNLDDVTFNESATSKTVVLNSNVNPTSIEMNNPTTAYSITGTGVIFGATGFTKTGTGALTLQTNNTFTGPASVTGSSVNVGVTSGLGTGPLTLSNATLIGTVSVSNSTLDIPAGTTSTIQLDGAAGTGGTANIPTFDRRRHAESHVDRCRQVFWNL